MYQARVQEFVRGGGGPKSESFFFFGGLLIFQGEAQLRK